MRSPEQKSAVFSRRSLLRAAGLVGASGLVMLPSSIGFPAPTSGTGFLGQAIDLATLQPVAGARVQVDPLGAATTTDRNGAYVLRIPPGTYTVRVTHDNFVGVIRLHQTVAAGSFTSLDLDLVPENPTPDQQEVLSEHLSTQVQAPLPQKEELTSSALGIASTGLPSQIRIYYDAATGANPPYYVSVSLEDYVKGVVPNEAFPSWPDATLQAQAVAARSYGVASYLGNPNHFVYPDTRSQVYNPSKRWPTTDKAVDATAGQVMTANGSVIYAFFFSQCNGLWTRNSEDAIASPNKNSQGQHVCTIAGWNKVSYCRARNCTGHAASSYSDCGYAGHGVGMCQWGAAYQGWAEVSYTNILKSYYTGITIAGACGGGIASSATMRTEATSNTTAGPYKVFLPSVVNGACS